MLPSKHESGRTLSFSLVNLGGASQLMRIHDDYANDLGHQVRHDQDPDD
jgi:hypothetical protein